MGMRRRDDLAGAFTDPRRHVSEPARFAPWATTDRAWRVRDRVGGGD